MSVLYRYFKKIIFTEKRSADWFLTRKTRYLLKITNFRVSCYSVWVFPSFKENISSRVTANAKLTKKYFKSTKKHNFVFKNDFWGFLDATTQLYFWKNEKSLPQCALFKGFALFSTIICPHSPLYRDTFWIAWPEFWYPDHII